MAKSAFLRSLDRSHWTQHYLDMAEVIFVVLDRGGQVVDINRKGAQILGAPEEEIVGLPWFSTFVPERMQARIRNIFDRLMEGTIEDPETFENPVRTLSGEERLIYWHNTVLRDPEGRIVGTLSSGTDVTRQRREAEELRRSQKMLQDMKIAIDEAAIVAMTDQHGIITYSNDRFCEISKHRREELLGKDHRIVNSGYHSREFMRDLWRTIGRGEVWRGEIRNRAKDGSIYWVDTTVVPFLGDQGKPYQYMAIRYEITERKRAEERLREQTSLARLGEMATVIAHEVRNPLAGIRGALQVVFRREGKGRPEMGILGDIIARIDQLDATMGDLLQYARPRKPSFAPLSLRNLLSRVVAELREDPRFAEVVVRVEGNPPDVQADADLLQGALLNVLINAAQAMDGRGCVEVKLRRDPGGVAMDVADTGPGIPDEVRARLFEPFFTTRHDGTGLGLSIVRRALQDHGGSVTVACPPAGGTVVRLHIPASGRTAAPTEVSSAHTPPARLGPPAPGPAKEDLEGTPSAAREPIALSDQRVCLDLAISGLAHDLGNPLAGLIACMQNLEHGRISGARWERYLPLMKDGLERMRQLLDGAVKAVRSEPAPPDVVNLTQVLSECGRRLGPDLHERELMLLTEVDPPARHILAGEDRFLHAMMSLLRHGINASDRPGEIEVSAASEPGGLRVRMVYPGPPGAELQATPEGQDMGGTSAMGALHPRARQIGMLLAIAERSLRPEGSEISFQPEAADRTTVLLRTLIAVRGS